MVMPFSIFWKGGDSSWQVGGVNGGFAMTKGLLVALMFVGAVFGEGIVPIPKEVELGKSAVFSIPKLETSDVALKKGIAELQSVLEEFVGMEYYHRTGIPKSTVVDFRIGELPKGITYRLEIKSDSISAIVGDSVGAAHAAATLLQLIEIGEKPGAISLPKGIITDGPDQAFRCFMVDMGRNPHSPKTLRHVIDTMWFYKAN
jgi:N-acetyl-beta-hexosaminidase